VIPEPGEVHKIGGDHVSLVAEPYVWLLEQKLQECIDKTCCWW